MQKEKKLKEAMKEEERERRGRKWIDGVLIDGGDVHGNDGGMVAW